MQPNNLNQEIALDFILAGNATFTLMSNKTKKRFTYWVKKKDEVFDIYFFNGSDNSNIRHYKLIGFISKDVLGLKTKNVSHINQDYFIAFDFVITNLFLSIYMPLLEIWHEGKCGMCGRKLTVPESIKNGIGPECKNKILNN